MKQTKSSWKKKILSAAIAIIFLLFVIVGIEAFYDSPKWETFCPQEKMNVFTKEQCLEQEGTWQVNPSVVKGDVAGWCNGPLKCEKDFQKISEVYNRNVFFIALILGIITIIIGGAVLKIESVSSGLFAGGVLTVVYGTLRYWGDMSNILRWIILGIVLAVLIWLGYNKIKD